jgi:hypothetical protein
MSQGAVDPGLPGGRGPEAVRFVQRIDRNAVLTSS